MGKDPNRGTNGGEAVVRKYGVEYFRELGRKGGRNLRDTAKPGHYSELGKLGGAATLQSQGPEHYSRIGKLGGRKSKRS